MTSDAHGKGLQVFAAAAVAIILVAVAASAHGSAFAEVARGAGRSSSSRAASSAQVGHCTRVVADQLLKRFHLGPNWPEAHPAGQVLCGAFTGPQSEAMAVSYALGVCMPYFGWGVFRFIGGAWKLVMTQPNGYPTLAAVGTDIRETWPVYRPGDGRCFPSGGTKARLWHWNGTRFTVSGWKLITPKVVRLSTFNSPDHKLWCVLSNDPGNRTAWCGYQGPPPPEHSGSVHPNGQVTLCAVTNPGDICMQNWNSTAPVLRYGQQDELYGYRCTSSTKGITCTVIASGKGFLINGAGVSRVGP